MTGLGHVSWTGVYNIAGVVAINLVVRDLNFLGLVVVCLRIRHLVRCLDLVFLGFGPLEMHEPSTRALGDTARRGLYFRNMMVPAGVGCTRNSGPDAAGPRRRVLRCCLPRSRTHPQEPRRLCYICIIRPDLCSNGSSFR